jgi:preprotein translocase subunit YajC
MTFVPALLNVLVATTAKKSTASFVPILVLLAIGMLFYFFFFRPQQAKAKAARANQGSDIEVGDEVQTIGGVIGTVLEIHGDRYTLLTGALGPDGNLDGAQPTRIVFIRQAIARKIERIVDIEPDGHPGYGLAPEGSAGSSSVNDPSEDEHDPEAEEA